MQDRIFDEGRFETPNASRYLRQLCKHFAHKVAADWDTERGRVALPIGPVEMMATPEELIVTVAAEDEEGLARARQIIDDHLVRFAHREHFSELSWRG
jgi:hypothetical protein